MRKLRWTATVGVSAAVAAVTTTTAQAVEGVIVSAGDPDVIPNGSAATLKDFSTARPNSLAAVFGGRVHRIFSTALNRFSGPLSASTARRPVVAPV